MAKSIHWAWLLLAYLIGSFMPITKILPGAKV